MASLAIRSSRQFFFQALSNLNSDRPDLDAAIKIKNWAALGKFDRLIQIIRLNQKETSAGVRTGVTPPEAG